VTHIILVRHGQTAWNRVERFRGRADIELNDSGLAQAEATARRIAAEWHPEAIYASPLSRARTTAQAIARRVALEVVVDAGLLDIDYGQWQGLTPDEAHSRWPEALDEIAVMARDLSLEPKPDDVKATIRGMMSASWVDLMDVRSVALRRYGGVDPRVELGLDPVVERLAQLALSIASLMGG